MKVTLGTGTATILWTMDDAGLLARLSEAIF